MDSTAERARLERFDREITEALKGPMNNVERAWLVVGRRDIRARLAELLSAQDSPQ